MHKVKATIYNKAGRIVSIGFNSYVKTHPLQCRYARLAGMPEKVYLHAEIDALIKAKGRGYRIFIERYNKNGKPLLAKPCPICQLAIDKAGLSVIQYTLG